MNKPSPLPHGLRTTAFGIGGLVATVLAFALAKEFGVIDASLAKRVVGMIFGVILIGTGNVLPKIVQPLNAHRYNINRAIVSDRFMGRTFVLAGILYLAIWVLAPKENAMLISSVIGLGAFVIVFATWALKAITALSRNQ
jgi:hypothetical protein